MNNNYVEVPVTVPQVSRNKDCNIYFVGTFIGIILIAIVMIGGTLKDA